MEVGEGGLSSGGSPKPVMGRMSSRRHPHAAAMRWTRDRTGVER